MRAALDRMKPVVAWRDGAAELSCGTSWLRLVLGCEYRTIRGTAALARFAEAWRELVRAEKDAQRFEACHEIGGLDVRLNATPFDTHIAIDTVRLEPVPAMVRGLTAWFDALFPRPGGQSGTAVSCTAAGGLRLRLEGAEIELPDADGRHLQKHLVRLAAHLAEPVPEQLPPLARPASITFIPHIDPHAAFMVVRERGAVVSEATLTVTGLVLLAAQIEGALAAREVQ